MLSKSDRETLRADILATPKDSLRMKAMATAAALQLSGELNAGATKTETLERMTVLLDALIERIPA